MVQLHLPSYEGPLDLLLDLIESHQLEISEISLAEIADQYLAQVAAMSAPDDELSPDRAHALAAFLEIGGRLVLIKARQLLPSSADPDTEEDAQADARELVELAQAYQRYRDGIEQLSRRDQSLQRAYSPSAPPPIERPLPIGMPDQITLQALAQIAQSVFTRAAEREQAAAQAHDAAIERQRITVRERSGDLRQRLTEHGTISFREWIETAQSRLELIVSFMAVLELHKALAIELEQSADFEDIRIHALADAPDSAWRNISP